MHSVPTMQTISTTPELKLGPTSRAASDRSGEQLVGPPIGPPIGPPVGPTFRSGVTSGARSGAAGINAPI